MEIMSKPEKEIDMTEGPRYKDVPYVFCIDCNAVLVTKVYRQYDYVPLCSTCRKKRR